MANMVSTYTELVKYSDSQTHFEQGLIRYKMVIHCIIDGYSRFVLGIRVHNNNQAASVLRLFDDAVAAHGMPSRMRGDHGVENVEVARRMEAVKGVGRGSFIWGRYAVVPFLSGLKSFFTYLCQERS
jgi:hypothetical protein